MILDTNCTIPELATVEINSLCNRSCQWCPRHYYDREDGLLPEEVFVKIVSELAEINFAGRFGFHLFN